MHDRFSLRYGTNRFGGGLHAESIVARFIEDTLSGIHGARPRVLAAVGWAAMRGHALSDPAPLPGHPDKRFNIAIQGERDGQADKGAWLDIGMSAELGRQPGTWSGANRIEVAHPATRVWLKEFRADFD